MEILACTYLRPLRGRGPSGLGSTSPVPHCATQPGPQNATASIILRSCFRSTSSSPWTTSYPTILAFNTNELQLRATKSPLFLFIIAICPKTYWRTRNLVWKDTSNWSSSTLVPGLPPSVKSKLTSGISNKKGTLSPTLPVHNHHCYFLDSIEDYYKDLLF